MERSDPSSGATPNRPLPRLVIARDWLGSVAARIGIGLVIFSLLSGVMVGADDIVAEWWAFRRSNVVEVTGTVTAVQETINRPSRRRRGESSSRPIERRTVRIEFDFFDESGQQWTDVSYTPEGSWTQGEEVPVEYGASDPTHARVAGTRTTRSPHMMVMMMAYGPIGFLLPFLSYFFYSGRRRLYREGVVAPARIFDTATMPYMLVPRGVAIEVEYEKEGTFGGTKRASASFPKGLPEDENLRVIYLPNQLMDGKVLEALPGGLRLNQWDEWVVLGSPFRAWLALLWPLAVALLLAAVLVFV